MHRQRLKRYRCLFRCFNFVNPNRPGTTKYNSLRPVDHNTCTAIQSNLHQQPPLHNGHLSSTAMFLACSPYIHSCFNFPTTPTSTMVPFFCPQGGRSERGSLTGHLLCTFPIHRGLVPRGGGGALGYFFGGYVPPGTPNWHPVQKKTSPKIDTPF